MRGELTSSLMLTYSTKTTTLILFDLYANPFHIQSPHLRVSAYRAERIILAEGGSEKKYSFN